MAPRETAFAASRFLTGSTVVIALAANVRGGLEGRRPREMERAPRRRRPRRTTAAVAVAPGSSRAALDVEARRAFWDRARTFVSTGRALLFTTHRLEEADAVADRVLVIAGGRLVADGTPDAITARADSASVVRFGVDDPPAETLERLSAVEAADIDGARVSLYTTDPDRTVRDLLHRVPDLRGLDVVRAGMEDAYLTLTRTKE